MEQRMPIELGYVTIPVPSVARAKAFFRSVLFGWDFQQTGEGAAHIGNTKLPFGFSTGGPVDYSMLYFKVTDIKAAVAKLGPHWAEARATFRESPSGLSAICKDDQGTAFSLWQPAPGFDA
jgi:predicted enzyme related to lactoylglutathione lyase